MKKNIFLNTKTTGFSRSLGLILLFVLMTFGAYAQSSVQGKVTDTGGAPVIGAAVLLKGTNNGTITDANGAFTLNNVPKGATLVVSFVGFKTQEVNADGGTISVTLEEGEALGEVVVTGVFDQRKRIDASVAISIIGEKELRTLAPVSAADLLKNIPGVFVNSSVGEVNNQVTVRGTPTVNRSGSGNSSGYFYVTMQEDGLPVTNVSGGAVGPDYYLRSDVNLKRVEAVRGGSSSITGSDAPGGVFNYVSKEGGSKFSINSVVKYGLEGDANPYYRGDLGFGGPLNKKKDLTYYVGGFYRRSDGARNPGFNLNNGGQVKANLVKNFKGGKLKLYGKFIDDRNGTFDFLPYTNYDKPEIAPGFKNTNTFGGIGGEFSYRYFGDSPLVTFNPENLIHSKEKMVGLSFNQSFGDGWQIKNNVKYSSKSSDWNVQYVLGVGSTGLDATGLPGMWGSIGASTLFGSARLGTISVKNPVTGEEYYKGQQTARGVFSTQLDKMPNKGYIFGMGNSLDFNVNEVIDQFEIHKKVGKSDFTIGAYFGQSKVDYTGGFSGQYLATLENRPTPLAITVTAPNGDVTQMTTPNGYKNNGIFYAHNALTNKRLDLFFGQTTALGNKLTLDYGFRYNTTQYVGNAEAQSTSKLNIPLVLAGGYDKNKLTEYDNTALLATDPWSYDRKYNSLAFSAALNYKISENQAIYGRYSIGQKAPDLDQITAPRTKESSANLYLEPIKMTQVEISYKSQMEKLNLYVTPFFSQIGNLAESVFASDTAANTFYNTTPVYSKQRSIGVEIEAEAKITSNFNVRANLTLQNPKSVYRRYWNVGNPGKADDKVVEVTDASIQLTPKVLASVTPSYTADKFYTSLSLRYVGQSPANANRAFDMAAYSQLDFIFGYAITKRLNLNFNINNVFNQLGVTGWYPPGGFPASSTPEAFTKAQRDADPNAVWGARTTQPRSFFWTLSYNF